MKRFLLVASLALAASAGSATRGHASGAFGLFYCPKYCSSYCQACCPFNAFSSNGCLMQCGNPHGPPCCPPPAWPMTGWGGGGCGAYGACATGPCCRNPAPHAMHLVQSSPQQLGPVCCHGCGMDTFGTGGLGFQGHNALNCGKGKGCKGGNCGDDGQAGPYGPTGYPFGPGFGGPIPGHSALPSSAPFWTANMNPQQAAGGYFQPVSYQGYYQPGSQMPPSWGYGYGYYPNFPQQNYHPAPWSPYGQQRGW